MVPATSTRGLALLDSIFASASQPNVPSLGQGAPPPRLPPQPEEIQIVSPKPQSSTLPQILNQNVISALLGLSPGSGDSRSSSAALSSNSSQRSGAKRYEGDNELSESEVASEGGLSASSTVLDALTDPAILARGSPQGIPSFSCPENATDGPRNTSVSIQGDVTPRAGLRGIGPGSPLLAAQSGQQYLAAPSTNVNGSNQSVVNGQSSASPARPNSHNRPLVPFSTDHELWPYPRPPLNDNDASDADIVELDFSDTRALSNPMIFKEKQTKQGKGERKRKGKKEKAEEREKERAAIENGWDDPTKGQVTLSGSTTASSVVSTQGEPSSSTTVTGAVTPNGKGKGVVNGKTSAYNVNGAVKNTADVAREALLTTLATHPTSPPRDLSRKQFVQEVLSLIYVSCIIAGWLFASLTLVVVG